MWIQVLALSCLLSFLEAKKSPECEVMRNVANKLRTKINFYLHKDAVCQQNIHCTGVNCTWPGGGVLEVDLHQCDQVYYHVFVNASSQGFINQDQKLHEGDSLELFKDPTVGKISIKVDKLSRKNNVITTNVVVEGCLKQLVCQNLGSIVQGQFCVKMESCADFDANATHYKPCPATTEPTGPHSEPEKRLTTEAPEPGNLDAHKGGKRKDDSSLSTAAIIGICAAGLIAILVVIGTVVYWKKYHHRSRLRAAYYNDISMHDPLYEDFGPEVA